MTMDETAVRLRGLAADFERLIQVYEERVAEKEIVLDRLEFVFGDRDLARTIYNFTMLGHLSYANQLRTRFAPAAAVEPPQ
jgi:hypothetical protein